MDYKENQKKCHENTIISKLFVLLQAEKCRYSLCRYALHYKRFQIGLYPLSVKPVCFIPKTQALLKYTNIKKRITKIFASAIRSFY